MKWWEKTVEYYFIQKYVADSMFIAPLDGKEEKAGDAIFSTNHKWLLIEFKRNEKSINSEKDKFKDYEEAKNTLQSKDGHHCIVYGQELDNVFSVVIETYFSKVSRNLIKDMLNHGVYLDQFTNYLNQFLSFKSSNSGGDGGIRPNSYMLVAGVSEGNKNIECLSLHEFLNFSDPSLRNNPDPIENYSSPSPMI